MMSDLLYQTFLWLDGSKARYWGTAWICFGAFLLTSLRPYEPRVRGRRWNRPGLYVTAFGMAMIAFRWPMLAVAVEFNPDESQLLAGAITSWHRHLLWSIDMGYCGPWAFLPLTLPALLGFPIDFLGGRCLAVLMSGASVALVWLTLRQLVTDRLARLLLLPAACLLIFTQFQDLVRYSGEQSAQLYLSLALWALVTAWNGTGAAVARGRLWLAGIFLGLLPFSKLQSAPLGLLLGLGGLAVTLSPDGRPRTERLKDAAGLAGGAAATIAPPLLWIWLSGEWTHFCNSYLTAGLAYAGKRGFTNAEFLPWVWRESVQARGFAWFLGPALVASAAALPFAGQINAVPRWLLRLAGALLLGAGLIVWAPGRTSAHYLIFLFMPTALLCVLLYGGLLSRADWPLRRRGAWLFIFLGLGFGPQVWRAAREPAPPGFGELRQSRDYAIGSFARIIRHLRRPGDALTVWGWASGYYVQTQLPHGTREAHTEAQLMAGPRQAYFRARFLTELVNAQPAFFVDAVGEGRFRFADRDLYAHECWPALHAHVARHYRLVAEAENARLYVRLDRLAEINGRAKE